jgi:hypothetical protein
MVRARFSRSVRSLELEGLGVFCGGDGLWLDAFLGFEALDEGQ